MDNRTVDYWIEALKEKRESILKTNYLYPVEHEQTQEQLQEVLELIYKLARCKEETKKA